MGYGSMVATDPRPGGAVVCPSTTTRYSTPAEEEGLGTADLESALLTDTLNNVSPHPPLVVDAGAMLAETIDRMRDGARCALMTDSGRLVGIFTERAVVQFQHCAYAQPNVD